MTIPDIIAPAKPPQSITVSATARLPTLSHKDPKLEDGLLKYSLNFRLLIKYKDTKG